MATQTSNGVITCEEPDTSHLDGYGVLFGYPIAHSLSPLLHQTIFKSLGLNRDYFLLPSTDIKQFLRLVRGSKCYGKSLLTNKTNTFGLRLLQGQELQCHINWLSCRS